VPHRFLNLYYISELILYFVRNITLSKNRMTIITVLPISGGRFVIQLAILKLLSKYGFRPKIMLASSGGTVASYVACAGHWEPTGITRVAQSLDSRLYVKSWFPPKLDFIHSAIAGIFYGAIYDTSQYTSRFFETYFTPQTITQIEMWVGAINYRTGAVGLFSNMDRTQARIQGSHFSPNMFKCEPLHYLSGDLNKITDASMASSSVPLMVAPRQIQDEEYIDCGTKFASPLTPIQDEIHAIAKEEPLHLFYINGLNVEADTTIREITPDFNIFTGAESMTEHVVRGFIIHDRMTAYEVIKIGCGTPPHYREYPIGYLEQIMKLIYTTESSLVELYPAFPCHILTLSSFTGDDVVSAMEYAEPRLGIRIWWNGESDHFDQMVNDQSLHYLNTTIWG